MTAHYFLSLSPIQPPSDILGLDNQNRAQVSFNVQAYTRPSLTTVPTLANTVSPPDLSGAVAAILQSHSPLASITLALNSNIFIGTVVSIPSGPTSDGPYILIRATGGAPPTSSHTSTTAHFSTAQIVVIAADYSLAHTLAAEVYSVCVFFNQEVTPI